ncbi:putative glycoside hydrolase [Nocardioides conyzicola]|uniref:Glycosyl hydrolase-like family 15 (GHL15) protein n=1 Tax=Nocardioides conyzicola TaxID=1651781 RepID=A0ABP8WPH0_9ACTN
MRRTLSTLMSALAVAALTGGPAPTAHADPTEPSIHRTGQPRQPTGVGVLALDWGNLDHTPRAGAGDYVVVQAWEYPRIPALKAANPSLRVLMYKDGAASVATAHETGLYSTGVSYGEAAIRHPDWFLTDPSGRRLEWSDWAGLYPMNVADRGYQVAWAANVLAELRAHDWDGVMVDDTLTYLSHSTVGSRTSTQIPTDEAMRRATGSFLSHVGPRIKNAGYQVVPNVTVEWNTWRTTLTSWTRYVSGWENEYFTKWGLTTQSRFQGADWRWKYAMARWCARRNKPLLAITYSNRSDRAAQIYHRATWLLSWNGRTGASIFVPAEATADHWQPRSVSRIGTPAGPTRRTRAGVYVRRYSRGLVLVNPSGTARRTTLRAGYRTHAGTAVSSVKVGARSATILRR